MPHHRKLAQVLCATIVLAWWGLPHALAQEQEKSADTTIRAKTSNVVVDLIVTDRHGRHVPGLSAIDFTIYEDGVPQKVISFTPSANSPSQAASPASTPAPDQNAKPAQTQNVSEATH